jgi:hypothetical protein
VNATRVCAVTAGFRHGAVYGARIAIYDIPRENSPSDLTRRLLPAGPISAGKAAGIPGPGRTEAKP